MKNFFTLFFLFFTISLFAQPVNDDCSGLIELGVLPFCSVDSVFTNVDATQSDIGNDNVPFACNPGGDWNFTGRDVWFSFVASDTIEDYQISVTGVGDSPLSNPQIAIYRGEVCDFDELALFACARAEVDGENAVQFQLLGLDLGETYFIRINDWSPSATPNAGMFVLCLKEKDPISTIDEMGTTACEGVLFDTGGPDGDYSSGEENVYTICPSAPSNACITFELEYYNLETDFDFLNFYDGPDTNSPIIAELSQGNFNNTGGVCYSIQASSGCLTVEMTSDGGTEFEGFSGSWQCSTSPCESTVPITVDGSITDDQIIDAVTTPQTVVTIDTIICPDGAVGTFLAGDDTDLGLSNGIILSSGLVSNAVGPNDDGGGSDGTDFGAPGDADLDYLSSLEGGDNSFDACVVELDVFVATNELNFEYIFGSDEYPEFVDQINDIFALLVSGPGIVGDANIGNQLNVAVIPGTDIAITVNNVNPEDNWEYYRDNQAGQSVEYDGLTSDFRGIKKSLTASIQTVPCSTYKLKLAIADRTDNVWDSGVFVGELSGGVPNVLFDSEFGIDYLVESCSGSAEEIVINLREALDQEQTYTVTMGGSATRDVDYTSNIPTEITLPPGETEIRYSIVPIDDMLAEGNETITISLSSDFGCGLVDLRTVTINIQDDPIIDINLGADTVFVCQVEGSSVELTATGVNAFIWTPSNIFDDNNEQTVSATPTESGYVYVSGTLAGISTCTAEDSVYLQIIDPQLEIMTDGETDICQGDTINLMAVNNANDLGFVWTQDDEIDDPNSSNTFAVPLFDETYVALINVTGCIITDTLEVNVDPFDFPELTNDTMVCQGSEVELAQFIFFPQTEYTWTPAEDLDDNTLPNPTATPQATTTFRVEAVSPSGFCQETGEVTITVIPAAVNIQQDTVGVCQGDTIQLITDVVPANFGIVWSPADSLSDPNTNFPLAYPATGTWYFATLETDLCRIVDSVFIQVDSLPTLDTIMLDETKAVYCPDEIITLFSDLFDPMDYPDITHQWLPLSGIETDSTFFNLVIRTGVDTITYTRYTTNNGCQDSVSVIVPVVPPNPVVVVPDTMVCAGEPFQVFASVGEGLEATYTWMPEEGLSCTDCPDPIIQVNNNVIFMVEADVYGCPATGNYNTNISFPPDLSLVPDQAICRDASITLNQSSSPNVTYSWTASDPNFTSVDGRPTVVPTETTTYSVVATNTNGICPSSSGEVTIEVIQKVNLTVTDDLETCIQTPFDIAAMVDQPSSTDVYDWSGTDAPNESVSQFSVTPFVTGELLYSLFFNNGCEGLSETVSVLVNQKVEVDSLSFIPFQLGPNDCLNEGERFSVAANVDTMLAGTTYEWTQNGEVIGNEISVETQVRTGDPITLRLAITTGKGCLSQISYGPVCVNPAVAGLPNAFTPSGTENNTFNIVTVGLYEEVESFRIWNRFGKLVYDNDRPDTGWDGKMPNGDAAPSDVYIYQAMVRKFTGQVDEFKGDVTLIR